jgi:hypothetical protein
MADKENVISLERLRKQRRRASNPPQAAPSEAVSPAASPGDAAGSTAPAPEAPGREAGGLIWLHCPTCGTLEYTELPMPGGRRHKCGTLVEEAVVEIDLRVEMTLAEINLHRIEALGKYLEQQRQRYLEYQRRLALIGGAPPAPYPLNENIVKALPVAEVDPVGLLISEALHNPARRFGKKE